MIWASSLDFFPSFLLPHSPSVQNQTLSLLRVHFPSHFVVCSGGSRFGLIRAEPLGFISHSWKGQSHRDPEGHQFLPAPSADRRGSFFFFSKVDAAPKAVIPNIHLQTSVPTTLHGCFLFLACFSLFVRSSVAPVRHFNELINVATLPHTGLDKSHFILEAAPVLLHSLILGWRLRESKGFCPDGFQGPL